MPGFSLGYMFSKYSKEVISTCNEVRLSFFTNFDLIYCTAMFDTGSQVTMISREGAETIDATEIGSSTLEIIGIGN